MRAILLLAAVVALALPAGAEECVPTTSSPEVAFGSWYIDNDECVWLDPEGHPFIWVAGSVIGDGECLFSIWWYEESNGIFGLQRHDEVKDDTCGGMIESDTFLS